MSRRRKTDAAPDDRPEKRFPTAAEINRALSAAQKLNLPVAGFTIHPDGRISIQTTTAPEPTSTPSTDWHQTYG